MIQNLIYDLPKLTSTKYENIFNVYTDQSNFYYYNLLQSVIFPDNLLDSFFDPYAIAPNDAWSFISYKKYGTIDLWWMICLVNKVQNPLAPLNSGDIIRIPKSQVVQEILTQLIA